MTGLRPPLRAAILLAPLLIPLAAPVPALAVTDPVPGAKDPRVRDTPYDPRQIVRLVSTGLSPLQVIFEEGERPVTIVGLMVVTDPKEAKDWLGRSSGNVLFLQPLRAVEPSVLFVGTVTEDGKERHYSFELRTREGGVTDGADANAYVTVRLTYPPRRTPPAVSAAAPVVSGAVNVASGEPAPRRESARLTAAERAAMLRFARPGDAGPRNYDYDRRGAAGCPPLAPRLVYDDGVRTTLLFAPHAVLPEVYVIDPDGKETITTPVAEATREGTRLVVPTVWREMRLRRGGKVCALRNNAFDPVGVEPGEGGGTVSPDVVRRVRAP